MKRRWRSAALLLLLLAVAAGAWWRFGSRNVPAGQPPLVTLDAAALESLRTDFNRASGGVRLIVLLSPT
jgi:hypothetical protein